MTSYNGDRSGNYDNIDDGCGNVSDDNDIDDGNNDEGSDDNSNNV